MKLSEFKKIEEQRQQNKQQLDELSLSSFIGDFGSAAVKSMFSGKGLKHQMIQDIFLKDFYDDAYTSDYYCLCIRALLCIHIRILN